MRQPELSCRASLIQPRWSGCLLHSALAGRLVSITCCGSLAGQATTEFNPLQKFISRLPRSGFEGCVDTAIR